MGTPIRALLLCSLVLLSLSSLTTASFSASSTDFFLSSDGSAVNGLKDPELMSALQNTRRGFLRFLSRFGKNYTDAKAFRHRLAIFERNLIKAVERQLADPTAIHGVTRFSDLTHEEFAAQYLGLRGVGGADLPKETAPKLPTDGLPTALDWREKGAVAEVKNQGMCGSCYAFSAVGAVEGAHYLKTGKLVSLSEQQIVDCDHQCDTQVRACDAGCNGGLMNNVFRYLETAGGLQREADYPYKGVEGKCRFDATKVEATVQKFVQVAVDDNQIAANLNKYGPLAVAINANWMQSYVRGVSCPLLCDPHGLNHGVLLVGYGQHGFSPARLKYKDYWIIKNSWGREWGESGFYRVCRGRDECGVESMVSAVVAVDSQREGEQQPAVDVA